MERIDNESTVKTTVEEKSDREGRGRVAESPRSEGGRGGGEGQSVKRTKKSKDGREEGGQGASMMSFNRRRKAKRHKKGKRRTGMGRVRGRWAKRKSREDAASGSK